MLTRCRETEPKLSLQLRLDLIVIDDGMSNCSCANPPLSEGEPGESLQCEPTRWQQIMKIKLVVAHHNNSDNLSALLSRRFHPRLFLFFLSPSKHLIFCFTQLVRCDSHTRMSSDERYH